jgi:hypothetical protein
MHTKEEIELAGRNGIGNAPQEVLNNSKSIKVPVAIRHDDDGVIYGYEVFFKKEQHEQLGCVWRYVRYIRTTA